MLLEYLKTGWMNQLNSTIYTWFQEITIQSSFICLSSSIEEAIKNKEASWCRSTWAYPQSELPRYIFQVLIGYERMDLLETSKHMPLARHPQPSPASLQPAHRGILHWVCYSQYRVCHVLYTFVQRCKIWCLNSLQRIQIFLFRCWFRQSIWMIRPHGSTLIKQVQFALVKFHETSAQLLLEHVNSRRKGEKQRRCKGKAVLKCDHNS